MSSSQTQTSQIPTQTLSPPRVVYVLSVSSVMFYVDGTQYAAQSTHDHYADILEILVSERYTKRSISKLVSYVDTTRLLTDYLEEPLSLIDGTLYYRDVVLPDYFLVFTIRVARAGFHIGILHRFFDRVTRSDVDISIISDFMSSQRLAITPDGFIIANSDSSLMKLDPSSIEIVIYASRESSNTGARSDNSSVICDSIPLDMSPYTDIPVFIDDNYDDLYIIHTGDTL